MNPHFLFNSLTLIEAGLGKQLPNVRGMVQALLTIFTILLPTAMTSLSRWEKSTMPSWAISLLREPVLTGN
jgi:hypothetical protein